MGPLLFTVLFLLSVVGGYRPARGLVELSKQKNDTDTQMWEASQRIVQCKPQNNQGRIIGIHYATHSGEILLVDHGSPAELFGLKEGEYIIKVDNAPFSMATCDEAIKGWRWRGAAINFTVEKPPAAILALRQIAQAMDVPLGLAAALLMISVPWLLAKAWVGGLEVSEQNLNHPATFLVLGAITLRGCREVMVLSVDWSYIGVRTKFFEIATIASVIASAMICLRNRWNPLLDTVLRADLAAELRKMDCELWILCGGYAFFRCAQAVLLEHGREGASSFDVFKCLVGCATSWYGFQLLVWGRVMLRLAMAVRQALMEVTEKLPCEAKLFEQEVHKPCANVLEDTSQKLGACGAPLLALAFELAMTMIRFYEQIIYFMSYPLSTWLPYPEYMMGLAARSCWITGSVLSLARSFLQLSRSQRDMERRLWDTRERDSALHLQVQAVRAMLEKVNDGQGWGFPVFDGFVLTKPLMQTLFLRALLAGSIVKAYLDYELGLEQEEQQNVTEEISTIADDLQHNISGLLQNQSSTIADDLQRNISGLLQNRSSAMKQVLTNLTT